jgi:uncharacterized protein YecT (DUF1311 family)
MKKALLFVWILLAIYPLLLSTDGAAKHPIDVWLSGCMEKNPSSQGVNACLGQAFEKWDLEMNRVYRELSGQLSIESVVVLREAQRAWIAFRDREMAWLAKFYGGLAGTMYSNMQAADRVDLVKRRVLELASYLDVLNQQ